MGKEKSSNTSSENKSTSSKTPDWMKTFISGVIGGVVVVFVQSVTTPTTAQKVMIKESAIQKRFEACEKAVDLVQRSLASFEIKGNLVPKNYMPTEKQPTGFEINSAYVKLVIYCQSHTIGEEFLTATGPKEITLKDVAKFISTVRKELEVDDKDFTGKFLFRITSTGGEDSQ